MPVATTRHRKISDSSIWIDFWRGVDNPQVRLLKELVARGDMDTGDLVLHEVLRGLRSDEQYVRVRREMLEFYVHSMVPPGFALKAAVNYRILRQKGITIRKSVDCLIATYCIESGIALLHSDRDFDAFEQHLGLLVVR